MHERFEVRLGLFRLKAEGALAVTLGTLVSLAFVYLWLS